MAAAPAFLSRYDGFEYEHGDPVFHGSIERGESEPYPRDLAVIRRYLRAFPHLNRGFVDVGAHIGTTALPLLRLFDRCVAYEPHPGNYAFLERNLRANGAEARCVARPVGCSDARRQGRMAMHGGGNSGCFFFAEAAAGGGVETVRLDEDADVARDFCCDFLKIDTEGHELAVLRGAEGLLRRCRPLVQVELNGLSERLFGVPGRAVEEFLASLGARRYAGGGDGGNVFFYFPGPHLAVVPRTIFCLWTGPNALSPARQAALRTIPHARLVTPETLADYVLESEPLHPAYPLLSYTHRADYLRTYLMHFYGGGYADIKMQTGPWEAAFAAVEGDPAVLACGYPEARPSHVAHPDYVASFAEIIGNGAYVFRPDSALTRRWYGECAAFLDSVLPRLRAHPAASPQDCAELGGGYPIEWNQLLGRIFHPLVYAHRGSIRMLLREPCLSNYR
jgi:FkbM family methyltransferase